MSIPQGEQQRRISALVQMQRTHFKSGLTRSAAWRREKLETVIRMVEENREAMHRGLELDLRRNRTDSDLIDVEYTVREARYALRNLDQWMKPEHEPLSPVWQPGKVRIRRDPFGVALVIGAWNEPYMLTLGPAIAALAAGNTVVIKPSEVAPNSAEVLAELVARYFHPSELAVETGGVDVAEELLEQNWDFIFFTGSPRVGRIIYAGATRNLTPCVLELGGKNPTIVHSSADIKVAARRIAFGRFMNAGQVCTSPDYVLVLPEVKDQLIHELGEAIREFYGADPQASPDFGRIVNKANFKRLQAYLGDGTVVHGGYTDEDDLYIAPTIITEPDLDSALMNEEIFGPILPIIEIGSIEEAIGWVNARPAPLGLYVFTGEMEIAEEILTRTDSGDACVNDATVQPMIHELPFGGTGNSGFGKYHGRHGFETFTNARGVFYHSTRVDPAVKYPPYAKRKAQRAILTKLL
ncbi:aldehyde dehydrogenase family protein [Actinomyces minihominis]|uniref:aldehyde dehydrogenase family protein n=1 Tax=Actinomyces minihominis TaxID=2002838 RepID=UPI000C0756DC|nr:aldehyde dehydrogenase family protein [Actinomyces minihominis]